MLYGIRLSRTGIYPDALGGVSETGTPSLPDLVGYRSVTGYSIRTVETAGCSIEGGYWYGCERRTGKRRCRAECTCKAQEKYDDRGYGQSTGTGDLDILMKYTKESMLKQW